MSARPAADIRLIDHLELLGPKFGKPMFNGGARSVRGLENLPPLYRALARKLMELSPRKDGAYDIALFSAPNAEVKALVNRGRVFPFGKVLADCRHNRCHQNSAIWALLDPKSFSIGTGYAGGKGAWREHSWLLTGPQDHVLEPTGKRDLYYGIKLTGKAMFRFIEEQLGREVVDRVVDELHPKVLDVIQKHGARSSARVQKLVSDFSNEVL